MIRNRVYQLRNVCERRGGAPTPALKATFLCIICPRACIAYIYILVSDLYGLWGTPICRFTSQSRSQGFG